MNWIQLAIGIFQWQGVVNVMIELGLPKRRDISCVAKKTPSFEDGLCTIDLFIDLVFV